LRGIRVPRTTLIYPLCVWVIRHVTLVSEPGLHNPSLQVMDDDCLYQRIDDIFQEFKKKKKKIGWGVC
jgi:hypothetical protein